MWLPCCGNLNYAVSEDLKARQRPAEATMGGESAGTGGSKLAYRTRKYPLELDTRGFLALFGFRV